MTTSPTILAMDLEGVIVPEIWIGVAEKTGIAELRRTTRDEPDYDKLMRGRIEILDRHSIRIDTIHQVIGTLDPLPGAREFLDWARATTQVIILSDTFAQFAHPLMRKLGWPTLFCHTLEIENNGRISGYRLRQPDQKRKAVQAFQSLNFRVIATGDSYNDTAMLGAAQQGILFQPSANVVKEFPQFPVVMDHDALRGCVERFLAG
ncbi:MAG: bifunctional phosphoserine phosphatase/homoserine phosphotransferase ThrH [Planctomycetota bacterium]